MKYLSKIIWLAIAVIFLASVIIGIGVIFSVKNVNVSLESYSYESWDDMDEAERAAAGSAIAALKEEVLGEYRGKLLGSVSDEKLSECLKDTGFSLENCERVYPCTLNLLLKERRETFAVAASRGFAVYDEDGEFLHNAESNKNGVDGAPNVLVAEEGRIKDVAGISGYFSACFSGLRTLVERVEIDRTVSDNMVFCLKCGVKVRIVDYGNNPEPKILEAYKEFLTLTGEEKMSGTIIATLRPDGSAVAERLPD